MFFTLAVCTAMIFASCEKVENGVYVDKHDDDNMGSMLSPATVDLPDEQITTLITELKTINLHDALPDAEQITRLNTDFPNARDVEWETGNTSAGLIYEAEFEIANRDYNACYNAAANLLMYVVEIKWSEVPQAVKNTIYANYSGYHIDDYEKINLGGAIMYQIDAEKGNDERFVLLREDGVLINEGIDY
jgi:hypothetical protein